jgi:FkbH-like protein
LALLICHLKGAPNRGALYAGQRLSELTELERTREENLRNARLAIQEEAEVYRTALVAHATPEQLAAFEDEFRQLTSGLVTEAQRHLRTLFIGDCLISEILSFVIAPLTNDGISIDPFPINPRQPAQLGEILGKLATKNFDVVFFSPFSHSRTVELEALQDAQRVISSPIHFDSLCDVVIDQTRQLLEELSRRFECPIFVHNGGLVPRGRDTARVAARLLLTYRARRLAARRLNRWLADYIATTNAETFPHFFIIDEEAIVQKIGRLVLGRFLTTSKSQHASVLSQHLALEYRARIATVAHLLGRKLVICDLDNTLWDGAIGEGPVTHFLDRQNSLKQLKERAGVILSIASKNDPTNVHFEGAALAPEDFVAPQITWDHKRKSIAKIQSALNLQTRHMIFLDDRPEERAAIQAAYPDILTLDPNQPQTWESIELWNAMAFGSSNVDRTRLYQEQALREAMLDAPGGTVATDYATLKELGLRIAIRNAKRTDLRRVAELINRTNQWNLCGTRTTYEQILAWHNSDEFDILVADVDDRFGEMGTVCVSIVATSDERAEIPVFVLSCRAFGYGIETAMLREVERRCRIGIQRKVLIGHYRSTGQNHPCRNMYTDHGFALANGVFCWAGAPPLPKVPWAELLSSTREGDSSDGIALG